MKKKRNIIAALVVCTAVWLSVVGIYHTHKALPEHLNYRGDSVVVQEAHVQFLHDLRWVDEAGNVRLEQNIFDSLFGLIEEAQRYILVDMFLFNSFGGMGSEMHRNLSSELTELLIRRKKEVPAIAIDFITDPINTVYGGSKAEEIELLKQAGVNVIITGLEDLRDSNFIYSAFWRTFVQWFGNTIQGGWLPHPFSAEAEKVTLRSYLRLVNFKANHRKVVVVDSGGTMATMVGSANPHGGSSSHSNVALVVRGPIWKSVYETEAAVAKMSGGALSDFAASHAEPDEGGSARAKILSERQIKRALLESIESASSGDAVKLAHFYLADRDIISSLVAAAGRAVNIQIVLDPNKDAFGYRKNGIPNRQAACELVKKSNQEIELRWYDTHGEQFHTKMFMHESAGKLLVILGSANLTRRNLDNFNLELDIELTLDAESSTARALLAYFDRIWNNEDGLCTVSKETYEDDSRLKKLMYRIQERFGLSTF